MTRLRGIDALRGVAVLMVLAGHTGGQFAAAHWHESILGVLLWPLTLGHLGVHLFLVLSGFCIHLRLATQTPADQKLRLPLLRFWKRRTQRLYPAYLAAMIYSIVLSMLVSMWLRNDYTVPGALAAHPRLTMDIATHLVMLHLFFAPFIHGLHNGVLWTLALEEHLYALYSPVLWLRNRLGVTGMLGSALVVCLAWRIVGTAGWDAYPMNLPGRDLGFTGGSLWFAQAPARWFEWCLGAAAAEAYAGRVTLPRWCSHPGAAAATLATALWAASDPRGWVVSDTLMGVGFLFLLQWTIGRECHPSPRIALADHRPGVPRPSAATAVLAGVGVFSYSLYLTHVPILDGARLLGYNLGFAPQSVGTLAVMSAAAVGSIGFAYLFYLVFERPFLRRSSSPPASVEPLAPACLSGSAFASPRSAA
jgi:peptidoglycan/LPS O-acetylase OafA/YrhL